MYLLFILMTYNSTFILISYTYYIFWRKYGFVCPHKILQILVQELMIYLLALHLNLDFISVKLVYNVLKNCILYIDRLFWPVKDISDNL